MLERRSYQCAAEMDAFIKLLLDEGVTSYLEIGSKFGGSLRSIGNALPIGSKIVSVDLCLHGEDLPRVVRDLRASGRDARLVTGNSVDDRVVHRVRELGPFDAVFIDGDHSASGVAADWKNYGPLGCVVAFHDIASKTHVAVPRFWTELKQNLCHVEICLDPSGADNGIGVIFQREEGQKS